MEGLVDSVVAALAFFFFQSRERCENLLVFSPSLRAALEPGPLSLAQRA